MCTSVDNYILESLYNEQKTLLCVNNKSAVETLNQPVAGSNPASPITEPPEHKRFTATGKPHYKSENQNLTSGLLFRDGIFLFLRGYFTIIRVEIK